MRVAIVGYGVEGQSSYKYFAAKGAEVTIFDESQTPKFAVPPGATLVAGKDSFKKLGGYDVIIRGAAVHPNKIVTNGERSSLINEFLKACPAPIIGVTGSKGKGTTTSLIYHMLKAAGKSVHIAGNIGVPALDILPKIKPEDIVVLELSSFQLWDVKISPHIAVVTMVEPEHLDVHTDVQEYLDAKANIANWQKPGDTTIYLQGNKLTEQVASGGQGTKIPYPTENSAHVVNDQFVIAGKVISQTSVLKIPGQHNIENACAAITAAWQFTQNVEGVAKGLGEFSGLDHRLKLVREVKGVGYYDDSIATTPGSAIAALKAFTQPKVLIWGGSDKGADFTELAQLITTQNMRAVIIIGIMHGKLQSILKQAGYTGALEVFDEKSTMQQIVQKAAEITQPGDVVLMSPACASFDMFKNYQDRGEQFVAAVQEL